LNEDNKKTDKKGKNAPPKSKKGLVIIILLVLVIGGGIAVYALNLFDLREDVLMPYLRNAPLIGGFMPPAEEVPDTVPLEQMSPNQLANMIRGLQNEIAALEERSRQHEARAQADAERIARLIPFYTHWSEYQRVSAEFNTMVARGDPEAFLRFYEYILPEFYDRLARDAMLLYMHDEAVLAIVRTLNNMQEGNAAETLIGFRNLNEIALLTNILNAMGNSQRGAILDEMEPDMAAMMLLLISVDEPILPPLAPALFTPEPLTINELATDEYEPDDDENGEEDPNGE
jgi:hypothetical protein